MSEVESRSQAICLEMPGTVRKIKIHSGNLLIASMQEIWICHQPNSLPFEDRGRCSHEK